MRRSAVNISSGQTPGRPLHEFLEASVSDTGFPDSRSLVGQGSGLGRGVRPALLSSHPRQALSVLDGAGLRLDTAFSEENGDAPSRSSMALPTRTRSEAVHQSLTTTGCSVDDQATSVEALSGALAANPQGHPDGSTAADVRVGRLTRSQRCHSRPFDPPRSCRPELEGLTGLADRIASSGSSPRLHLPRSQTIFADVEHHPPHHRSHRVASRDLLDDLSSVRSVFPYPSDVSVSSQDGGSPVQVAPASSFDDVVSIIDRLLPGSVVIQQSAKQTLSTLEQLPQSSAESVGQQRCLKESGLISSIFSRILQSHDTPVSLDTQVDRRRWETGRYPDPPKTRLRIPLHKGVVQCDVLPSETPSLSSSDWSLLETGFLSGLRSSLPETVLRRWQENSRRSLELVTVLETLLLALSSAVFGEDSSHSELSDAANPADISSLLSFAGTSIRLLAEGSASSFASLLLARRDALLGQPKQATSSSLRPLLRSLPPSGDSLFGPFASGLVRASQEARQHEFVTRAASVALQRSNGPWGNRSKGKSIRQPSQADRAAPAARSAPPAATSRPVSRRPWGAKDGQTPRRGRGRGVPTPHPQ